MLSIVVTLCKILDERNMFDFIQNIFKRKQILHTPRIVGGWYGCNMPFGNVIFRNIYALITNILNDVTFTKIKGDVAKFAMFKVFIEQYGQMALNLLFERGFSVVGMNDVSMWLMHVNDYITHTTAEGDFVIEPKNKQQKIFVLYSDIFEEKQISYKQHLTPYINYIDSVLNSSATLNERLGTLIIGSPKNLSNAPTEIVLPKSEKDRLEKELSEDYGSLSRQKQIMLLPREMNWQTINLSGFDNKTYEKLNIAVMVVADALQVPANQVSLIDSFNSKAFSNGSELREGDFLKYATFERLLNSTLIKLAKAIELNVTYSIYNKPVRNLE